MSKLALFLILAATLVCPLATIARAADTLAASIDELAEPGVIDPVEGPECDCVGSAVTSDPLDFEVTSFGFETFILFAFRSSDFFGLVGNRSREVSPVAFLVSTLSGRLSWLQTFRC